MNSIQRNKLRDKIHTIQGLTDEERSALLGLLNESKTYGLVWEDKPEAIEERLRTELPVLKEVKSKAIISDNADAPNHIIIEGDNLESLTTLAYTHEGKIDVIYIDPPYNTGNKDFVYNDSYVDSEDSYRHSKWLSFMAKRLRIAKKLLSERGVIFISIDDNEQANLKLLCDEIFGERKFRNSIFVRRRTKTLNLQFANNGLKTLNIGAEYVLVYSKNNFLFREMRVQKKDTPSKGTWNVFWSNADRPTMRYELLGFTPASGQWRWSQEMALDAVNNYLEYLSDFNHISLEEYWNQTGRSKRFIRRIENGKGKNGGVQYWVGPSDTHLRTSNWTDIEVSQIYKEFNIPFDNPKNIDLIKTILTAPFEKYSTILDFFAGSGTTLHAVMQLNAEDGGKRQCILCTNNENNICEEVTYERNKRVIQGYTKPNGERVEGLHDNNLRYYKTAFASRRRTPQNMRRLMLLASDMLCIKENLYTELDAFGELQTLENGFRYFAHGDKQMLIIYNEEAIYTIIEQLEQMTVCEPIVVYVFSPGNDAWNTEFVTVSEKVRLTALPSAIYNAYKRVLPNPKDMSLTAEAELSEPVVETEHTLFDSEEGENE